MFPGIIYIFTPEKQLIILHTFHLMEFQSFSPREAYAAYMMGSTLVDVRESNDTATSVDIGHLLRVPFSELGHRLSEIPNNRTVVLVSNVGIKSKEAARFLLSQGYEDVATVDGGLRAWEEEGLPIR